MDRGQSVLAARPGVVLPVCRCRVHKPRSFRGRHVVPENDGPEVLVAFGSLYGYVIEGTAVPLAFEVLSRSPGDYSEAVLAEHLLQEIFGQDHTLAVYFYGGVLQVGPDGDGSVGYQGPRCRCPYQEAS